MNQNRTDRAVPMLSRQRGFTLIEVMITVAIVAILAAVALPSYRSYVIRAKLVPATNALSALRTLMEQYYLDNRTYLSITTPTAISNPCATMNSTVDTFTLSCGTPTATTYTLTATGSGTTAGAVYTLDQSGLQATTGVPTSWGSLPASHGTCWLMRKGDSC